jgi:hypothetical protein
MKIAVYIIEVEGNDGAVVTALLCGREFSC